MDPCLNCTSPTTTSSLDKKPKAEQADILLHKRNDGTEDGGPEYSRWSWGRRQRRRNDDRLHGE